MYSVDLSFASSRQSLGFVAKAEIRSVVQDEMHGHYAVAGRIPAGKWAAEGLVDLAYAGRPRSRCCWDRCVYPRLSARGRHRKVKLHRRIHDRLYCMDHRPVSPTKTLVSNIRLEVQLMVPRRISCAVFGIWH